jgi:predicted transport protein
MTIIEYINKINIKVKFEDGYVCNSTYRAFKKGEIKNPYDRSVYNIGYLGEGDYKVSLGGVAI